MNREDILDYICTELQNSDLQQAYTMYGAKPTLVIVDEDGVTHQLK